MTNREYLQTLTDEDFVWVIEQLWTGTTSSRDGLLQWLKGNFHAAPEPDLLYKPLPKLRFEGRGKGTIVFEKDPSVLGRKADDDAHWESLPIDEKREAFYRTLQNAVDRVYEKGKTSQTE